MSDRDKPTPGSIDDEVAFHLEMRQRELVRRGLDPEHARREARRRFGDPLRIKRDCNRIDDTGVRVRRRRDLLGEIIQDLRISVRRLVKAPGFSMLAILILAIGIGANSAIFSVLNTVVLRPLPYEEPERLVEVWESSPSRGWDLFSTSQLNYRDFRDRNDSFEALAGVDYTTYDGGALSTLLDGEPVRLEGRWISREFFAALAVEPILGRGFAVAEDTVDAGTHVVLLGEPFWRERFGADETVVGRSILLNDEPYDIIGVMPRGHFDFDRADVYVPLRAGTNDTRADHRLQLLGRLEPGVSRQQAEADLDGIAAQLALEYPDSNEGWDTKVISLYASLVPAEIRSAMYILVGAVGLVLLIACANLSSLLLARTSTRKREIAVYSALGAGRGRIARQMLTETTLLALIGGSLGTALAVRGAAALRALDPSRLPRFETLTVDGAVLAYAAAATLLTALLAGLLPAWQAAGGAPAEALKEGGRAAGPGATTQRARRLLLAAEVALSIVLLAGAGLLLRSFLRVQSVDPGLDSASVLTLAIDMPFHGDEELRRLPGLFRAMLDGIEALPGVESAGTISGLPFGGGNTSMDLEVEGRNHGGNYPSAYWRLASPHYFETMGIPLLRGRAFHDVEEDPRHVAIISASMARRLWPGQDPIGRRFLGWRDPQRVKTVIGVVGDVRERSLETAAHDLVYMPHLQMTWWSSMYIVVRTDGDPTPLAPSIRAAIARVVPERPVTDVRTLDAVIAETLGPRRFNTSVLLCFAAVALLLAAAGVYGVTAYSVAQRGLEIGVRMAMGAGAGQVLRMLVRQGMRVVLVGVAAGAIAAAALTRLLASMLYTVAPLDPLSIGGAALFLVLTALLACVVPALRAARIDPVRSLREG